MDSDTSTSRYVALARRVSGGNWPDGTTGIRFGWVHERRHSGAVTPVRFRLAETQPWQP
jgi:hypothetical protein